MRINEIFRSIQGEGYFLGKPAVFVRMCGCNLHCGFCDQKESWNEGVELSILEIIHKVERLLMPKDLLIITGGEPTIQPQFDEFTREIRKRFPDNLLTIETNGEVMPITLRLYDWITVSPKTENALPVVECADEIKIVVPSDFELTEFKDFQSFWEFVKKVIHRAHPDALIWFQPDNNTEKAIMMAQSLLDFFHKDNIRLGIQAQKVWGMK
jgi:7-carboxy-7-deazaguanine synthase